MSQSPKFIAERPRRILDVLRLPDVLKEMYEGRSYILSVFMGMPIIIHPSRAHIRLGIGKRLMDKSVPALTSHGFDGNTDETRSYKIGGSTNNFWGKHIVKSEQEIIEKLIPIYDGSRDAIELSHPVLEGPPTTDLQGRYWRMDLIGLMCSMRSIGGLLTDYHGSYQEVLLRELGLVSPLFPTLQSGLPRNKKNSKVQEFYCSQISLPKFAEEYEHVQGAPYHLELRQTLCRIELTNQSYYKRKTKGESDNEEESPVVEDKVVELPKKPRRKTKSNPVIVPPEPDVRSEEVHVSASRMMMEELSFQTYATLSHPDHGDFPVTLLCGMVIMLDKSNNYVRLFVNPKVYKDFLEPLRAAGLEEDAKFVKFISSTNSTKPIRDWRESLGGTEDRITKRLEAFPTQSGPMCIVRKGGTGCYWISGTWWRVELLPYIMARVGLHIPQYAGSREEILFKEWAQAPPLCDLLAQESCRVDPKKSVQGYLMGVHGEEQAEIRLRESFGSLGEIERTGGQAVFHSADFRQNAYGIGVIIHEIKNKSKVIPGEEMARLLKDVDSVEESGKICVAATMISFRSEIADHRDKPVSAFLAPNGHTLIICINKVTHYDALRVSHPQRPNIFDEARGLVDQYFKDRVRTGFWKS